MLLGQLAKFDQQALLVEPRGGQRVEVLLELGAQVLVRHEDVARVRRLAAHHTAGEVKVECDHRAARDDEQLILVEKLVEHRFLEDLEHLQIEDDRGVPRNANVNVAARTVGELGRDVELPAVARRHELQSFSPASDDIGRGKDRRAHILSILRRVENGPINQRASVPTFALLVICGLARLVPRCALDDRVL